MRRPCCCARTCPSDRAKLLAALGATGPSLAGAALGARRRRARSARSTPLFPKDAIGAAMIDSHTHLDLVRARPTPSWSRRPREAGVTRMLTVGIDGDSAAPRSPPAERLPEVCAAIGRHPNARRRASTTPTSTSCASSPPHAALRARSARPGLDFYRDRAPRADQERAFAAQIELARDDRQAARDPHARGRRRHDRACSRADADGRRRGPALLLDARRGSTSASSAAGGSRSPATSPTRRDATLARRPPRRVPADRLLVETDAPYLTPQAVRKQRNQPAYVVHTRALRRRAARRRLRGARARRVERNAARAVRLVSEPRRRSRACAGMRRVRRPAQPRARPELPDRLEHPRRDRPRGRARRRTTSCSRSAAASACCPSTSPRASRTCTWWRSTARSSAPLRDALDPHPNATLHFGDAIGARPGGARSGADEGRREPALRRSRRRAILRTIEELPGVDALGRDGAARGRRAPRGRGRAARAYGAPSVLAQLACDVRVLRPVSRTVFIPVPNVDSVLVGLRRGAARRPRPPALRALVQRRRSRTGARRCARLARAGRGRARAAPSRDARDARGPRSHGELGAARRTRAPSASPPRGLSGALAGAASSA